MIDIRTEELVTFREAARRLPPRRGGRHAHVATFYRWALRGIRGIKLEIIQIAGSRCTSMEALQRFFDRLDRVSDAQQMPPRTSATRQRQIESAERELNESGI